MTTKLATNIAVDDPVPQTAALRTDRSDRRYIDDQVLAIQQHLVDSALSGIHATWFRLAGSSAAVIVGDCVCMVAATAADNFQLVTKALTTPLVDAKSVTGVVLQGGAPGSLIRVAIGGMVPNSITGLPASTGAVRVNPSTGRCDRVATIANTDYPIGTVNSIGALTITPTLSPGLQNFSVSNAIYSIDVSSATPSAGKVVALKSGSTNELLLVVAISGAFQGGPLGVLPATHVAGDVSVAIAIGGTLPNSITGLGNSSDSGPRDVTWDLSTGALKYINAPHGGELVIGHSPGDGRVTIATKTSNDTAPLHTYNPLSAKFGGSNDGLTPNDTALSLLQTTTRASAPNAAGAIVDWPNGTYFFANDVHLTSPLTHRGRSAGVSNLCTIWQLAPGRALFLDGSDISPDGGFFDNGVLEDIRVQTTQMVRASSPGFINPSDAYFIRQPSTRYEVGRVVIGLSNTAVAWRCTTAGTTSSTGGDPAGFTGTTIGATVTDGGVVWTAESYIAEGSSALNPAVPVGSDGYPTNGTVVPVGYRMSRVGDRTHYFEVEVSGASSGTMPTNMANIPALNELHTDGSLKWRTKVHGIQITTNCRLHRGSSTGFANFAFTVQAGGGQAYKPGSNNVAATTVADFVKVDDWRLDACGGGWWTHGFDSQNCTFDHVISFNGGANRLISDQVNGSHNIVSSTNASPIVLQVTAHGLHNNDRVTVQNHLVNTNANGIWTITVVDANHFSLNASTGNGVGAATGTAWKRFNGSGWRLFKDTSLSGCHASNCYDQVGEGPGYELNAVGLASTATFCGAENNYPVIIGANATWNDFPPFDGFTNPGANTDRADGQCLVPGNAMNIIGTPGPNYVTASINPVKVAICRGDGQTLIGFRTATESQDTGWSQSDTYSSWVTNGATGWYGFGRVGTAGGQCFAVNGPNAALAFSGSLGGLIQVFWVQDKLAIGPYNALTADPPYISYDTAAPSGGTRFAAGSLTLNRAPAIGSPISWVTTAAGAPGTAIDGPILQDPNFENLLKKDDRWSPGTASDGTANAQCRSIVDAQTLTGAGSTTVATIDLADHQLNRIDAVVKLWKTDYSAGAEFKLSAAWLRNGATVTQKRAPTVDSADDPDATGFTCVLAQSSTNVNVNVTAAANVVAQVILQRT